MNEFLKKKIETQKIIDSITHTSTSYRTSKTPVIVGVSIFMVFFIAIALVIFSVSSKSSGIVSKIMAGWQAPSISKFNPFAGSKNEVCWLLMNSSRTKLDSSKFTLRIIDPKANTVLNEFNFLPVMTWKEGFNADARIGDFIQYGYTI
ncbi:MAG TPA: hypothetical protein VNX68_00480, partial [Nitrosopumilaceae archaeon]|nr:hypothetical protein [Nitrosopumilaceae archaeon]